MRYKGCQNWIRWLLTIGFVCLLCGPAGVSLAVTSPVTSADVWDGTVATAFAGGDGRRENPYQIATGAQLAYLAALSNVSGAAENTAGTWFALTKDIDLDGREWAPIGNVGAFYGNFDGKNHVVYNISVSQSPYHYDEQSGFFGKTIGSVIRNLGLENLYISITEDPERNYMGGLVGEFVFREGVPASVTNCYTNGKIVNALYTWAIDSTEMGGLIGRLINWDEETSIAVTNCSSTVELWQENKPAPYGGGLIGLCSYANITNCFAAGDIHAPGYSIFYKGGLAGRISHAQCEYGYWNSDAMYYSATGAEYITNAFGWEKEAVISAQAKTAAYMQTTDFVDELNTNCKAFDSWSIISGLNKGYPVCFAYYAEMVYGTADTSYTFPAKAYGYGPQTAHQVTLRNIGTVPSATLAVTLSGNHAGCFTLSDTEIAPIGVLAESSFSVTPVTGLAQGTYTATINVSGADLNPVSYTVSYTVEKPDYTVQADPAALSFGSVMMGYAAAPPAQSVTITNKGNMSVMLTQPASDAFTITTADSLTLAPNGTAVFSVRPQNGLTYGTYHHTLLFQTDHASSCGVDAVFTVNPIIYPMTGFTQESMYILGHEDGLEFTAAGPFAKFTGVFVNGSQLYPGQFSVREGSTIVELFKTYLSALTPGSHKLRIHFTDGYAEAGFSVVDIPKTGDVGRTIGFASLAALAVLGFAGFLLLRRRRRNTGG